MSCEKDQIVTMSLLHHISIQSHIEIGQTNHCFSSNRKLFADSTRVETTLALGWLGSCKESQTSFQ